jgi:hypothetical protein
MDGVLGKLRTKLRQLDQELFNLVRSQADLGNAAGSELVALKAATQELFAKIKRIQEKALQSETLVQDITKDIKSLDNAKRNLALSSMLIKRLQLIVSTMDQAKQMSAKRKYAETTQLLQVGAALPVHLGAPMTLLPAMLMLGLPLPPAALPGAQVIRCLESHFEGHRKIIQISNLLDNVAQFRTFLKKQILMEFESCYSGGTLRTQGALLHDACQTLEVLEPAGKEQLIEWYCNMQLTDYRQLFKNPEISGLDNVGRRYAWLKRLLKTFDEHASAFPPTWRVGEAFCFKFCEDTKRDVADTLLRTDASMDVKVMLQALQLTTEFELGLAKRFHADVPVAGEATGASQMASPTTTTSAGESASPRSRFHRIISSTFEPYLGHYVLSEEKVIASMMDMYLSKPITSEEEAVLASSADLFYYYRQSMQQCAKFSTKASFLKLCDVFKRYLKAYADFLLAKVPREDRRVLTAEETRTACLLINTAEYCSTTIPQLEERCRGTISPEFADKVDFAQVGEAFLNVALTAIQGLVRGVEVAVEPALGSMSKRSWGTVDAVGDQSEYVSLIAAALTTHVTSIRKLLQGPKYFRTFCDRFTESFLTRYYASIMKCKPISEVGAEQMLLDTHSLRALLMQMTSIGEETRTQPPTAFVKLVGRGVLKIEQLLKVVLRPIDPVAGIVETFILLNPEFNANGFQRILELKVRGLGPVAWSGLHASLLAHNHNTATTTTATCKQGLKRADIQHVLDAYYSRHPNEVRMVHRGTISMGAGLPPGLKAFGSGASTSPQPPSALPVPPIPVAAAPSTASKFGGAFRMNFSLKRGNHPPP